MSAQSENETAIPRPELAIYMSSWRAALLVLFALPFLLGSLGLFAAAVNAASLRQLAMTVLVLGLCIGVAFQLLFWVARYRPKRGPMYVFTAKGLIIGSHFAGEAIPWVDVWISTSSLLWSGPLVVQVDFRKEAFRADPGRRSPVWSGRNKRGTMGRIIMPNIATLRGGDLQNKLVEYARADGVHLPDDR